MIIKLFGFSLNSFLLLLLFFLSKVLAAFFILKFVGFFLSPSEFGILSQYMAFLAILFTIPLLGGGNYVTKSLSEINKSSSEWRVVLRKSVGVAITSVICVGFCLFVIYPYVDKFVFIERAQRGIYIYLIFAYILNCFLSIAFSAASATNNLKLTVYPSIFGAILYIAAVYFSYVCWGYDTLYWTLPLLYVFPSLFVLSYMCFSSNSSLVFWPIFDKRFHASVVSYGVLTITGVVAIPLISIILRQVFSDVYGWGELGNWQAAVKISDTVQQFFGIMLSYLVLPYFVKVKGKFDKRLLLFIFCFFSLLSLLVFFASLYWSRPVVMILYGEGYYGASEYMPLYIAGDFCRMAALVIVFYFISMGRLKIAFIYEVLQGAILGLLIVSLIGESKLIVSLAYFITYAVCLVGLLVFLWAKVLRIK